MNSRTKIEHELLSLGRSEEVQHLLRELSAGGEITVSLSSELAHLVAKFLSAALDTGAVAFTSISPEITPEQAAKILHTELSA
ncbi:hypothetical protein QN224_14245 [Sinorhizobium sp. 8-89]|uniref:hypothetical protein n=1 Tax=Sinorhizobium sp. 7-81 TaxID=3049087 RepID=UPI0024C3A696|nr:hypothetical protein [Sinorhizobium sp. 7-81]MDK1386568.1 hypothetical protein [Sinorhizobium sp. 7-81]